MNILLPFPPLLNYFGQFLGYIHVLIRVSKEFIIAQDHADRVKI